MVANLFKVNDTKWNNKKKETCFPASSLIIFQYTLVMIDND